VLHRLHNPSPEPPRRRSVLSNLATGMRNRALTISAVTALIGTVAIVTRQLIRTPVVTPVVAAPAPPSPDAAAQLDQIVKGLTKKQRDAVEHWPTWADKVRYARTQALYNLVWDAKPETSTDFLSAVDPFLKDLDLSITERARWESARRSKSAPPTHVEEPSAMPAALSLQNVTMVFRHRPEVRSKLGPRLAKLARLLFSDPDTVLQASCVSAFDSLTKFGDEVSREPRDAALRAKLDQDPSVRELADKLIDQNERFLDMASEWR